MSNASSTGPGAEYSFILLPGTYCTSYLGYYAGRHRRPAMDSDVAGGTWICARCLTAPSSGPTRGTRTGMRSFRGQHAAGAGVGRSRRVGGRWHVFGAPDGTKKTALGSGHPSGARCAIFFFFFLFYSPVSTRNHCRRGMRRRMRNECECTGRRPPRRKYEMPR